MDATTGIELQLSVVNAALATLLDHPAALDAAGRDVVRLLGPTLTGATAVEPKRLPEPLASTVNSGPSPAAAGTTTGFQGAMLGVLRTRALPTFVATTLLAFALPAGAQPTEQQPPSFVPSQPLLDEGMGARWYGWQPLGIDVAATVAFVAGSRRSTVAAIPGAGLYLIAPPLVHVWHGHPTHAALSGAGRAVTLAITGAAAESQDLGLAFGAFASFMAVSIVDAASSFDAVAPTPPKATWQLVPTAAPTAGGGFVLGAAMSWF